MVEPRNFAISANFRLFIPDLRSPERSEYGIVCPTDGPRTEIFSKSMDEDDEVVDVMRILSFMPRFMLHFFKKLTSSLRSSLGYSQKSLFWNVIVPGLVFVVGCPRKFKNRRILTFSSSSNFWPRKSSTWGVQNCGGLV